MLEKDSGTLPKSEITSFSARFHSNYSLYTDSQILGLKEMKRRVKVSSSNFYKAL